MTDGPGENQSAGAGAAAHRDSAPASEWLLPEHRAAESEDEAGEREGAKAGRPGEDADASGQDVEEPEPQTGKKGRLVEPEQSGSQIATAGSAPEAGETAELARRVSALEARLTAQTEAARGAAADELAGFLEEKQALHGAIERLSTDLVTQTERLSSELGAIAGYVARLEQSIREIEEREEGGIDRPESESLDRPREAPDERKSASEALDVNRASFEDLRGIGLSVTQAARFVSQRDARGGFRSLEELDELPGFPREQVKALKRTFRL